MYADDQIFYIWSSSDAHRNLDEFSIPRLPVSNLKFVLRGVTGIENLC